MLLILGVFLTSKMLGLMCVRMNAKERYPKVLPLTNK